MQYGMIPKLDQFVENQNYESQKIQNISKTSEVKTNEKTEELQKKVTEKTKNVAESSKAKEKLTNSDFKYEALLTNVNFGYNSQTKDFYVRVERGNSEIQYPTEQMMKLKAYFRKEQSEFAEK